MEFTVDIDNVRLLEESQVESGEYNVTECNFTFSVEYEELTKKAVFTGEDGIAYLETIVDNKCSIPSEILAISQKVEIGVYGYSVDNEELLLRYSPKPTRFFIYQGSYKEAQNSTPPTPSEIEQLQAQITENANNIDGIIDDIIDINAEQTEQNTNIQTNTNNITTLGNTKADKSEIPTKTSDLINDSGFVEDENYVHTDNNFTNEYKNQITTNANNITTLQSTKADKSEIPDVSNFVTKDVDNLINYTKTNDLSTVAISGSYNDLTNKPTIPSKTSDLTNDSGFITKNVDDLTNYYKKNETYNQQEIDTKISSVYRYKGTVSTYQDLPSTDLTIGDVYNVESDGSNYAWTGTIWDKLGGEIDLSDYYTKGQVDTTLADYVKNTDYATPSKGGVFKPAARVSVDSNGKISADTVNYSTYETMGNSNFIGKGTLENVITGKNLETANNKVTSLSSSSTDTQYPSAKCVYDLVGDIETVLTTLDVRKRGVVYEYKFKNNRDRTTYYKCL